MFPMQVKTDATTAKVFAMVLPCDRVFDTLINVNGGFKLVATNVLQKFPMKLAIYSKRT